MFFSNRTYDILKRVAIIVLPAIGTLYFALCQIWGLPYGEEIIGTVAAVDTFLGAILGVSTKNYGNLAQQNASNPELDDDYFEGNRDE